jgi:hypothetical protein
LQTSEQSHFHLFSKNQAANQFCYVNSCSDLEARGVVVLRLRAVFGWHKSGLNLAKQQLMSIPISRHQFPMQGVWLEAHKMGRE